MTQQVIWAPWRMAYILDGEKKSRRNQCLFCQLAAEDNDEENLILYRGEHAYVLMNRFPYNNGHLLIVPYVHTDDLNGLNGSEYREVAELFRRAIANLEEALQADGFNGGINLGKTAGAGIDTHLHFHIVPRWQGDYNFMPVIAETKVMPQHLQQTYALLKKFFTKERMAF